MPHERARVALGPNANVARSVEKASGKRQIGPKREIAGTDRRRQGSDATFALLVGEDGALEVGG